MCSADTLGLAMPFSSAVDHQTVLSRVVRDDVIPLVDCVLAEGHLLVLRFSQPFSDLPVPPAGPDTTAPCPNTFRRQGRVWQLAFEGDESFLPTMLGLSYLHDLIAHERQDVEVEELYLRARTIHPIPQITKQAAGDLGLGHEGDLGALADAEALNAAHARLTNLEQLIAEAESLGNTSELARLEKEKAEFVNYLAQTVGLKRKPRLAGSPTEKLRQSVRSALRDAIRAIEKEDPTLAAHLDSSLSTGTYCRYQPKESISWQL